MEGAAGESVIRTVIWFIACLWIGAAFADEIPRGQLPSDVTPLHYALELTVLPDRDRFSGTVTIDAFANAAVDHIWMHGSGFTVDSVAVTPAHGEPLQATWSPVPDTGGVVRVDLPRSVAPGNLQIAIRYSAPFNRELEGFYRADEDGEHYVFSQMEPIAARRAFPSFDEPRFKTPFDIAVTVRAGDTAISNAPVLQDDVAEDGHRRIQFATTKPLPTYLVALAVGPFDVVTWKPIGASAIRDHDIPLRGIAAKGKGRQLRYALANTEPLLHSLEDYFGVPYPYDKLDIIAAIDFAAGAMENAGAIVYRESYLLMDDSPPIAKRRRYAMVHAHEMAHQWFGDLVTPAWWNDIWLNESFATWMETRAAAAWDPKGDFGRLTVNGALNAMTLDSWRSARRIAEPIRSTDDIANAFDSITYDKGAGVLAMFEHYYGPEKFRKGVQLYLRRHAWGTATATDFIDALTDATGDTRAETTFRSFLDQPGVPVVRVAVSCGGKPSLTFHQTRYIERPRLGTALSALPLGDQQWTIPLCVAYGTGDTRRETCDVIAGARASTSLPSCPTWIMPNADAATYVRFALERKDWDALIAARDLLHDTEVLAILDSLEAGFIGDQVSLADYVARVRALLDRRRGDDQLPLTADIAGMALPRLVWIKDVLAPPTMRANAERLIHDMFAPATARIGVSTTPEIDGPHPTEAALLRPILVTTMALEGNDPQLRAAIKTRGLAYLANPQSAEDNDALIETELTVAVQDGGAPVVAEIAARLGTERDGTLRQRLLLALTHTHDPALAAQVRALAFDNRLRVNEVSLIVYGSIHERENADASWAWFKQNFDAIVARTPPSDRGELAAVGSSFCATKDRDDYERFFHARLKPLTGAPRVLAETLEQIDSCIALKRQFRPEATKLLAAQ